MKKSLLSALLVSTVAASLVACGSADNSTAGNDTGSVLPPTTPAEPPAMQPPFMPPSIPGKIIDGESLSAANSASDPTSMRDLSGLFTQFDPVMADMQMIHDVMTGRPSGNQPGAGVIPFIAGSDEKLTCETLTQIYIDRILQFNDAIQPSGGLPIAGALMINPNALDIARALDEQFDADVAANHPNGGIGDRYLHCMPVLLKDNYDTFDHPSSSASPSMFGHQAGEDAPSVAGMRDAGAVILGKAQQDEFAFFTTGFSGRTVLVTNPYNTSESPAGSSSGSGASIAARFAVGATGSDTCQSIRHPSSVNGLVGIRPSIGVVSREGIFPLVHTRDTGGPMTKTVRDVALQLTAMASLDPDVDQTEFPFAKDAKGTERFVRPDTYVEFLDREKHGVAGKKIGLLSVIGPDSSTFGTGDQGTMIRGAAAKLMEMGAEVYEVRLPDFTNVSAGNPHYDMNIYFKEFYEKGGESPRRCVSSVGQAAFTNDPVHPRCAGIEGIIETRRVGPRTAAFMDLVGISSSTQADNFDARMAGIVAQREAVTAIMDGFASDLYAGASVRRYETPADVIANTSTDEELVGSGIFLDVMLLSPGPTGGRTCDFGSTTQMGSIVVPLGIDAGPDTPRGIEIFTRRYDEGTGLGVAFDLEQQLIDERLGLTEDLGNIGLPNGGQNGYLLAPDIIPDITYANQTIGQFNTRIKFAIQAALNEAPESDADQAAINALNELLGNSDFD